MRDRLFTLVNLYDSVNINLVIPGIAPQYVLPALVAVKLTTITAIFIFPNGKRSSVENGFIWRSVVFILTSF